MAKKKKDKGKGKQKKQQKGPIKEKREKKADRIADLDKKKEEEFKTPVTEEPAFGIFAEKLKTALGKQKKPSKTEKKPKKKKK